MSAKTRTIRFTLNGEKVSADVAPHHTLVEVLHQHFSLVETRPSIMCATVAPR